MSGTTSAGWQPAVQLDLETASPSAFQETVDRFMVWNEKAPPLGPLALPTGWHDITPECSEDALRRNNKNRKVSLATVKKYYRAMKIGDWMPTGQGLIFNRDGKMEDGQNRTWAGFLGNITFHSFVVSDVPVTRNLFAYLDDGKPRSVADAIYTSGSNGISNTIASTVKLAWRYDAGAMTVMSKQPRIQEASVREALKYIDDNPNITDAAHLLVAEFGKAHKVIGDKAVGALFLWKAAEIHGPEIVRSFLTAIGTGANLNTDDPILAFRERLRAEVVDKEGDMGKERRLALLIKAFNMHIAGKKIGRQGLYVRDNEKFPRIDMPLAEAAE